MPIGEPIAWYGPIVMNTQEDLQTVFEEYRLGTFIKRPRCAMIFFNRRGQFRQLVAARNDPITPSS
jgi:hypothetical protein